MANNSGGQHGVQLFFSINRSCVNMPVVSIHTDSGIFQMFILVTWMNSG